MSKSTSVIRVVESPADSLELAIKCFQKHNESRGLSQNSISTYHYALKGFSDNVGNLSPAKITSDIIRKTLSTLLKNHAHKSVSHTHTVLCIFFKFLVNEGILENSPMAKIDKIRVRKTVISTFTESDIQQIINSYNSKNFVDVRDKALIMLMIDAGLRASEVCNIKLRDIDWANNTIRVIGKGDKERVVPFGEFTRKCINSYITKREKLDTKNLFVTSLGDNINRYLLYQIVKKRCKKLGIVGVRCSPHTFRHTSAVTFLRNGGDVFSLQKILGHSSLDMTRHYCELSNTDIINKHRLYSPGDSLMPQIKEGRKRLK